MAKTLALIGSIVRATEIETRSLLRVSGTEVVLADELSTIVVAPTGSFDASFANVSPSASFLMLDADGPLDVTVNDGAPTRAQQLYMSGSEVVSLSMDNPSDAVPVTVRLLIGG